MRPKRSSFNLEFQRLARHFYIVVQQFQPWILPHTQPYDSSPAKVRKGANPAEGHEQRSVPSGDSLEHGAELFGTLVRLVAQEFQREVQEVFANPRQFRNGLAERGCCVGDVASNFGCEIDREKEPQSVTRLRQRRGGTATH